MVAVTVTGSVGDYRAGDQLWCEMVAPDAFGDRAQPRRAGAPRRPAVSPSAALIGRDGARLQLLPPGAGSRQVVIPDAPWLAVATTLIRALEIQGRRHRAHLSRHEEWWAVTGLEPPTFSV